MMKILYMLLILLMLLPTFAQAEDFIPNAVICLPSWPRSRKHTSSPAIPRAP